MILSRELKKPVEDMVLRDAKVSVQPYIGLFYWRAFTISHNRRKNGVDVPCLLFCQPLPELTRVKDLKISGNAFADLCMVQEFLHNFGAALDIGRIVLVL